MKCKIMDGKSPSAVLSFAFWFLFIFSFCLSGMAAYLGIIPGYKLGYLPVVLVFVFCTVVKVRKYHSYQIYLTIILLIIFSSFLNDVSLLDIALYLRYPVFFFLIAWLVDLYITGDNMPRILKAISLLAISQFPVVILQIIFKHEISATSATRISFYDTGFGTFNFSTDYAMSFFLLCFVALILNSKFIRQNILNYKIVMILSIVTILTSGAQMVKIMLFCVILFSLIKARTTLFFTLSFILIPIFVLAIFLFVPDIDIKLYNEFASTKYVITEVLSLLNPSDYKDIYINGFSRPAVIRHAFTEPITWFGFGPHSVYNPITGIRTLPTTDTLIITYFELGFIGLLSVLALFFSIFFKPFTDKYNFSSFQIMVFLSFLALCFTAPIFPDIAVQMTIFIFLKIYTLSKEGQVVGKTYD